MTTTLPGEWLLHSTRCSSTGFLVSRVVRRIEKQARLHEPESPASSLPGLSSEPMQQISFRARLVWMMRMSVSTVMMASGMERNTASRLARRRSFSVWMPRMASSVSTRSVMFWTMGKRYRGWPAASRTMPAERCTQTSWPCLWM